MTEIILIRVSCMGWMARINIDGKEVYRGEYRPTSAEALMFADIALEATETEY